MPPRGIGVGRDDRTISTVWPANIREIPPSTLARVSGTGLVGRTAELDAIAGVVEAVAGGQRQLLVVRGEAGIGKTRLLEVVREQAAGRRLLVLDGRASELEGDVPFAPLV